MAAGTPPFAPGIPPAAADTPPSGGPGLDRPPSSTCPAAPSARRGTALSRPHRPRRSISSHRRLRTGAASFVFRFMAAERRLGEGRPPRRARPGPEEPTDRRSCPREAPHEPPSTSVLTVQSVVNGHSQVFERAAKTSRTHRPPTGRGDPPPKRRKCAMNPNANEKQGHGAYDRRPDTPLRGGSASGDGCERLGQDGMGLTSRRRGTAAPRLHSTPLAMGRRPRTWTARRSPRGGPPRPRNGSA